MLDDQIPGPSPVVKAGNYSPIFQKGSMPYFLVNKGWSRPLLIVVFGNVVLVIIVALLLRTCMTVKDLSFSLLAFQLVFWDICYLLTQFLNPGIQFFQDDAPSYGYDECTRYCHDCQAYIKGYDHHCGWFQKCIGHYNKYPFYLFLIFTFGIFFTTMYCLFSCEPRQH